MKRSAAGLRRAALALSLLAGPAAAQVSDDVVRIGVLTDLSGPYADSGGRGSVIAAEMAAADAGGWILGKPVEIVSADHQNKPDVASSIARRWYDVEKVDAVVDLPVTAIALAVQAVSKEKNRTVMITAAATSDLTAKTCSPTSSHWTDDTHALTAGTARAVFERGGRSWYFITVDHAFGHALQKEATAVVESLGGKVVGTSRHPIATADYSSFLLQAQSSGADVVAFASVGDDFTKAIKQANEFGLTQGGQTLTGFLVYITDIKGLGLPVAHGLTFSSAFYWDQSEPARAFAKRFQDKTGVMPTKNQALIYTAVTHYLKAVAQAGTDEALAVNKAMRAMPVAFFGHPATLRADGRLLYDPVLYRVKGERESKGPWDLYEAVRSIPQGEAFLPINPACAGQNG
ncbi:putative ABC branched-chain amino transporter, periplasmic binding protein [Methylobacterium sp. 4-46]|uniref:ABC transporter substrate-binding protein n=1 Tax=unclassified Methylobacterium TaxID=2615210 RepID=UPI000152D202|nr:MULTISPECIES: ABC transporter substrate-binding protein [Methylobacterium]ACA16973.1 putative ABC branched-chain amino transporter, periplasmic binding protein [Methylobacterium sp. 4-46]WFT82662.1 ABC transporter substrate-binding protein [Methylobacterium nodulans]